MATPHTARQLNPAIGATVAVRFESLTVQCIVLDAKNAYGSVRLLVYPVCGEGEQWVDMSRVRITEVTADPKH